MNDSLLRTARFPDIDPGTLYALLRLRVDVFVVEQNCAYPELDGRDTEPDTLHCWYEMGGWPVSYVRVLQDRDGTARIGRVCTAAEARGAGLGGRLLASALELIGGRPCRLDAQSHLTRFYVKYGFQPAGPEFLEDGIRHTPMRRPALVH